MLSVPPFRIGLTDHLFPRISFVDRPARSDEDTGCAVESGDADETGDGLPDSFADFLGSENKSVPERINDQVVSRYDIDSALEILSIEDFLTSEDRGEALTETQRRSV